MKKILAALIAASMIFVFGACDSTQADATATQTEKKTEAKTEAKTEEKTEEKTTKPRATEAEVTTEAETTTEVLTETEIAADNGAGELGDEVMDFINNMATGSFYFDFELYTDAESSGEEGYGSIAVDGDKIAMVVTAEESGVEMTMGVIVKDGKTYLISVDDEYVLATEGSEFDLTEEFVDLDFDGVVFEGRGEGEVNGVTLPYEEYSEDGSDTVRFYLSDGMVYAIESYDGDITSTMIIENFTTDVDADYFEIPEDFEIIEY
jgi:hypothetical protein